MKRTGYELDDKIRNNSIVKLKSLKPPAYISTSKEEWALGGGRAFRVDSYLIE